MDLWDLIKLLNEYKQAMETSERRFDSGNDLQYQIALNFAKRAEQNLKRGWDLMRDELKNLSLKDLPFGNVRDVNFNTVGEWMDSIELPVEDTVSEEPIQ